MLLLLQKLKEIDFELLLAINRKWSNHWFDQIIPWLRYQQLWYPFYIFLAVFTLYNFGQKAAWWIAGFILTVSFSDSFSSRIVKNAFERLRPCNDPDVAPYVQLRLPNCGGGFSFTSSHAANHFAMAMFIMVTFSPFAGKKVGWIFIWPIAVSYAQVYVGVHYPFDVMGGALLGSLIGFITGKYFHKKFPLTA